MSIVSQKPDRNRKVRAGMVLLLVLAGTALIGFGGLAAWQAVTQNNGSTASTLGVHHSNVATVTGGTAVSCTDQTSPSACGVIFDVSKITPGYGPTQAGTVAITNIGSETSTFSLQLSAAPAVTGDDSFWTASDDTLCSDLQLTISDSQTASHIYYSGSLVSMPTLSNLMDNGGNTNWITGATDTFKFTLALPNSSPNTDEDSTCTASFTWGQNGV
ncbi:MAG: hypothetical protein WCB85_08415 [Candidatus Dormiibacterota bacterium]